METLQELVLYMNIQEIITTSDFVIVPCQKLSNEYVLKKLNPSRPAIEYRYLTD